MFSALSQGSQVYLLDKTSSPEYKIGEIVGVSYQNPYNIGNTVDLKIKVDGNIETFSLIPSINSIVSYNNGKLIISETKLGILNEVEGIIANSKQVLNNIDIYKRNIADCENILKQLNPQFAVDKERDERLTNLESRFDGVESKLDKIFNLIQK